MIPVGHVRRQRWSVFSSRWWLIAKARSTALFNGWVGTSVKLQGILSDLESGALEFDFGCEDIHMFVEQVLTQRLGDVGKKLHTARSRNDQVTLDLRMYLKDQIDEITALVKDVLGAIVAQAENNKGEQILFVTSVIPNHFSPGRV